jgi:hypothetical protein
MKDGCWSNPVPGYESTAAAVPIGWHIGFRHVPPAQPPETDGPVPLLDDPLLPPPLLLPEPEPLPLLVLPVVPLLLVEPLLPPLLPLEVPPELPLLPAVPLLPPLLVEEPLPAPEVPPLLVPEDEPVPQPVAAIPATRAVPISQDANRMVSSPARRTLVPRASPDESHCRIEVRFCKPGAHIFPSAAAPAVPKASSGTTKATSGSTRSTFVVPKAAFVVPDVACVTTKAASCKPNVTFVSIDATFVVPKAAFVTSKATFVVPDASSIVPHATFVVSDATFVVPDATSIVPHATFVVPDATFVVPRATFVTIDVASWELRAAFVVRSRSARSPHLAPFHRASLRPKRGRQRGAQLVPLDATLAPLPAIPQELAQLALRPRGAARAPVHQRVRPAERRSRGGSGQRDRDERAAIALTTNAAPRACLGLHGLHAYAGGGEAAKFSAAMCYLQGPMAEASSSGTPAEPKKPEKPRAKRGAAPQEAGPLTRWSTWGVIGVVLFGAIVVWKLWGSSYAGDVRAICDAEKGSGFTIAKDAPKVTQWIRANLDTPEGNTFYSTLNDTRLAERGKRLQAEADSLKLPACPLVAAYERLDAEAEYRADLQHICSSLTFPKLAELDDDGRLAAVEDWIDKLAKSPRTKELGAALRSAPAAARPKVLRDTGTDLDVFSCETARILEGPQAAPTTSGVPVVRLRAPPEVTGSMNAEELTKVLVDLMPGMTACYQKGLTGKPSLSGQVAIKVHVDPDGKVTRANAESTMVEDRDTLTCMADVIRAAKLPKNPGPLVSILVPLDLIGGGASAKK